jgi:hypothetical protein
VLCSVLRALEIPCRIRTASDHAWVSVELGRQAADLLFPEGSLFGNTSLKDTSFKKGDLVWARRLGADESGRFLDLPPLVPVRARADFWVRPWVLLGLVPLMAFWVFMAKQWNARFPVCTGTPETTNAPATGRGHAATGLSRVRVHGVPVIHCDCTRSKRRGLLWVMTEVGNLSPPRKPTLQMIAPSKSFRRPRRVIAGCTGPAI